ncbi:hypothetical protein ABH926_000925 [Catenulispora sp. GP43]
MAQPVAPVPQRCETTTCRCSSALHPREAHIDVGRHAVRGMTATTVLPAPGTANTSGGLPHSAVTIAGPRPEPASEDPRRGSHQIPGVAVLAGPVQMHLELHDLRRRQRDQLLTQEPEPFGTRRSEQADSEPRRGSRPFGTCSGPDHRLRRPLSGRLGKRSHVAKTAPPTAPESSSTPATAPAPSCSSGPARTTRTSGGFCWHDHSTVVGSIEPTTASPPAASPARSAPPWFRTGSGCRRQQQCGLGCARSWHDRGPDAVPCRLGGQVTARASEELGAAAAGELLASSVSVLSSCCHAPPLLV